MSLGLRLRESDVPPPRAGWPPAHQVRGRTAKALGARLPRVPGRPSLCWSRTSPRSFSVSCGCSHPTLTGQGSRQSPGRPLLPASLASPQSVAYGGSLAWPNLSPCCSRYQSCEGVALGARLADTLTLSPGVSPRTSPGCVVLASGISLFQKGVNYLKVK